MREVFLHYVWQLQLFNKEDLFTTQGQELNFYFQGYHNQHAGLDFSMAKIKIDQLK